MKKPVIARIFSGALNLGNQEGTLYDQHTQTGVLNLQVSNGSPGGWALVPIVANGSAINLPVSWIKYGGDDVSVSNGNVNHLQVFYKDAETVYYTNKVTTP